MLNKKILLEQSWLQVLEEEFKQPYMESLRNFLILEKKMGYTIYPEMNLIFNAFFQTPFNDVKVVIVGQDPYHGPNQAHGLSFSVRENVARPPSLQNIYKELVTDVGIEMPKSGCLEPWAKQGVLLLNATLSVRAGEPLSHYGKGWEIFTDAAVEKLALKKDPIVFLLWGKSAQEKCFKVFKKLKENPHLVLTAAHPSFYSVAKFFGCKHFSKTNEFLIKNNKTPIDWQLP